jgi:hypothetical protein
MSANSNESPFGEVNYACTRAQPVAEARSRRPPSAYESSQPRPPAMPGPNRPSAAAKRKKRIPLLTFVYHRYTLCSMNVASAARPPLERLLNEPRLALPRAPAPAPLPPPPVPAFNPLHSGAGILPATPGAGILPASRRDACPIPARHAGEQGRKPAAFNNRLLQWASKGKCAQMCGNVRKKIKIISAATHSPHARSPSAEPGPSGGQLK